MAEKGKRLKVTWMCGCGNEKEKFYWDFAIVPIAMVCCECGAEVLSQREVEDYDLPDRGRL
ncbi:hypothetical protein LCGC14_0358630 [marine sediment metagenome]|uniref:Uncharacterized protein n=1 Tax=marine sediment metagenome TaxID=412755 RepID=A0A0F9WGS8_9ZZZZ